MTHPRRYKPRRPRPMKRTSRLKESAWAQHRCRIVLAILRLAKGRMTMRYHSNKLHSLSQNWNDHANPRNLGNP